MGLWRGVLSREHLEKRFARFHKVSFGLVPKEEWPNYFADLIKIEDNCACSQFSIGRVDEFPFEIGVDVKAKPTKARVRRLPKAEREWVK